MEKRVLCLVLSTGYSGPASPHVIVDHHDYCHGQAAIPPYVVGYTPRPDGTDSVPNGIGTRQCLAVLDALRGQPFPWLVVSIKAGDTADPLAGVQPEAVQPALRGAVARYHTPQTPCVAFLDYDLTGSPQVAPLYGWLTSAGVPLVLPVGAMGRDLDLILPPTPPGVLAVAGDSPASDYGEMTVDLAAAGDQPGPVALAWLAFSRFVFPEMAADAVIARVCRQAYPPSPRWAGRSRTGGVLRGGVR